MGKSSGNKVTVARTERPPASGGKNNQPVVKTRESVDVEARQLSVQTVKDVDGTCTITP